LIIRTLDGTLTVLAAAAGGLGVSAQTGETFLQANGAGANDDLVVNHTVTSTTGKINLDSFSRDVTFSADGDVTATGGAEIEVDGQRHVTMSDGTVLNANAGGPGGGIDIDARTGDVTLGSVQTTSAQSTLINGDPVDPELLDNFAYEVKARFAQQAIERASKKRARAATMGRPLVTLGNLMPRLQSLGLPLPGRGSVEHREERSGFNLAAMIPGSPWRRKRR